MTLKAEELRWFFPISKKGARNSRASFRCSLKHRQVAPTRVVTVFSFSLLNAFNLFKPQTSFLSFSFFSPYLIVLPFI